MQFPRFSDRPVYQLSSEPKGIPRMSTTLNPAEVSKSDTPAQRPDLAAPKLAERFGMTEESIADRRAFIGLNQDDHTLMLEFVDWAKSVSLAVAKDLLEHQFAFAPTRHIFERRAKSKGVSIEVMREGLEKAQAAQFEGAFTGAVNNWDLEHFEKRLYTGWVHAQFHLPFKWYLGAYPELLRIAKVHLRRSGISEARAIKVVESLNKVFNLDIQAIGDSFLLNTLELCGLDISAIMNRKGSDRTEHLDQVQLAVSVLIKQANALADDRLRDTVLERQVQVAGKLGDAFGRAHARLVKLADQADLLARGDLQHHSVLAIDKVQRTEVLGSAMKGLYRSIKQITELAAEIGQWKAIRRAGAAF